MFRFRALSFVAFALIASSAVACTADAGSDATSDEQGTGGGGEDEIRGAVIGNIAAVKINGGPTVAAPAKLRRILENIGLGAGAARPPEGGIRCMPSFRLEMLDAKGEVKAYAGFVCDGSRQDAKGTVHVNDKSYLITAKDVDALEAIGKEPLAVADVLFGADRAEISNPRAQSKLSTRDGALIAKLAKSMQGDQVPDPTKPVAKCLPSRALSFFRGTKNLGGVSFSCSEGARGTVSGSFSGAGDMRGAVEINAGTVFDLEGSLTKD